MHRVRSTAIPTTENHTILTPKQGLWLGMIYNACLLRRNRASVCNNKIIGDSLPRVKALLLNWTFTQHEENRYRAKELMLVGKIPDTSRTKTNQKWRSSGTQRKLNLATTWLDAFKLEAVIRTTLKYRWCCNLRRPTTP